MRKTSKKERVNKTNKTSTLGTLHVSMERIACLCDRRADGVKESMDSPR